MYFIGRLRLFFANNSVGMSDHHGILTQFFFFYHEVTFSSHTMLINASTKEFALVNNAIPSYDIAFGNLLLLSLYYKIVH